MGSHYVGVHPTRRRDPIGRQRGSGSLKTEENVLDDRVSEEGPLREIPRGSVNVWE